MFRKILQILIIFLRMRNIMVMCAENHTATHGRAAMTNKVQDFVNTLGDVLGTSGYAKTTRKIGKWIPKHGLTRATYNENREEIFDMAKTYRKDMDVKQYEHNNVGMVMEDSYRPAKLAEMEALTSNVKNRLAELKN